jgi:hypothetical protein
MQSTPTLDRLQERREQAFDRMSKGRRFADGEAIDRILASRRGELDRLSEHQAGLHTELAKLGGGPGPQEACVLCQTAHAS